jgi:hypothetical protein
VLPDPLAAVLHRVTGFLDAHPYVRVFAMPIVLMAAILLGLFLAVGNAPVESMQVVAMFVVASVLVVGLAILAEQVVAYVTQEE